MNTKIALPTLKPAHTTHFLPALGVDKAYWIHRYLSMPDAPLLVVITNSQHELNQLETELAFFGVQAHVFADYETLVYDQLAVHQDVIAERVALLTQMPKTGVLLVSVQTLMGRIVPPDWLFGWYFDVSVGERFDRDGQTQRLVGAGYVQVDTVYQAGEFALRGGIMDIFVVGQALPCRIELFDDEIESIKFFDPDSQRTLDVKKLDALKQDDAMLNLPKAVQVDSFRVLPAGELPFDDKETFRQNFAQIFGDVSARKVAFYQDVMNGIVPAGVEYYAPLFFELDKWLSDGSLFHYLPKNTVIISDDTMANGHAKHWEQIQSRYTDRQYDKDKPILPPSYLFLPKETFFAKLNAFAKVQFGQHHHAISPFVGQTSVSVPALSINHKETEPLSGLLDFVADCDEPILFVAETQGRKQMLLELFGDKLPLTVVADFAEFAQKRPTVAMSVAPIEQGIWLTGEQGFCVMSETQIFGRKIIQTRQRRASNASDEFLVKSVAEMTEGSLVVHLEHGIARYRGLVILDVGDGEQEFIELEYAENSKVYVPITSLSLISRYGGADTQAVALSKLGSGKWDRAKQKTLEQIHDVAAELLNIQARRHAKQGISFNIDMANYELFASEFAYDETFDQMMAIQSVMHDMKQSKPMDRLICGDVGFGKTEVAMRSAFIAVQAGYQVAVLVPTTLLARQHEDSFKNRFANWAVKIESLSRFGTKKHHDKVLADVADGKVDIVIGTHRLLQGDVKFHKLGLMIIDEEHRFGVRHKEKIKSLQSDVDSLSMTATPIPRTLNMALSGMQDISIIATPPARRLPIKTFVLEKQDSTIKEAILREILRGGQVYFLHNDVASIGATAQHLRELVPESRVGMAHGQMPQSELSAVMADFYHKKYTVLVASTIIETGLDVPNANTIIINRADKFGLAQLHQLRGRVGRSHHQAYCYLLVPSIKGLTADAKRRLDAISRANTLGAGFMLASEDLEIRGAGEILGKEQSGNMQSVGFGLYMDMLQRATSAIKAGKTPRLATPLDLVSDINIHASALIPDDYLSDVHERLLFYKRIGNAQNLDELKELRTEMIDRFGVMPTALANLFLVHKMRIQSQPIGITKIDLTSHGFSLEFKANAPVDGMAIIKLVQSNDGYRMNGATGLKHVFKGEKDLAERTELMFGVLDYFAQNLLPLED
ncbi:MAG: transcription-repair coupling factor [Moraxella sp.]|nr:transcription-repair coupling factor [Moraxella sp.]